MVFWKKIVIGGLISTIIVLLVIDAIAHSVKEKGGDEPQDAEITKDQSSESATSSQERPIAIIGKTVIQLEIADTDATRTRGLSGRETLEKNRGLLFVFERPGHWGIWMKDMNFPIDIIWLDENFRIISIKSNVAPESYPEIFYPDTLASYVLEVNAGVARQGGLKVGDMIEVNI